MTLDALVSKTGQPRMAKSKVSVPLDREPREFVEAQAQAEDRSVDAGQIRHLVAEAARLAQQERAA
jgi:hypothetical protein